VLNLGVWRNSYIELIKCSSIVGFSDQRRIIRENTEGSRPVENIVLYDVGGILLK